MLGRKLRPFSLAHRLVLEALDSPLVSESTAFAMGDLLLAARVCSMPNPFRPLLKPTWMERVRFWRGTFDPSYFRSESQKFVDYLDDHSSAPKFWNRLDQTFARTSVPWLLDLAAGILRRTSFSEREVWLMPIGKAFWYYTALCKQEGHDPDILTTDEEAFLDSLKMEASK